MTGFRITQHTTTANKEIVEILIDGEVAGAIYPTEEGIKIVSAHFKGVGTEEDFSQHVSFEDGSKAYPPIPTIKIILDPERYTISNGKIVKLGKGHLA